MAYQNLYNVQSNAMKTPGNVSDNATIRSSILYLSLDKQSCSTLREHLNKSQMTLVESQSIFHVQQELISRKYAICVVRCHTVSESEFELLQFIKQHDLTTRVIISAQAGNVDLAVRLMKAGAIDFVVCDTPDSRLAETIVNQSVQKAPSPQKTEPVKTTPKADNIVPPKEHPLVGESRAIRELRATIQLVAKSRAPVLITGESGTGKEIVARQLHHYSERLGQPCIALNCAALPSSVIENELFGHEKGAFSGAITKKFGCFELADQGTLFLDEIAEMDLDNQAKLLRVLENKSFRRLGGKAEITVDVKVVAATNKRIHEAIQNGEFREDLYYRLSVIEIEIPPLRERKEDIIPLVNFFLSDLGEKYEKDIQMVSGEALDVFLAYDWPGNVRELRNVVERAVVMCQQEEITLEYVPSRIKSQVSTMPSNVSVAMPERHGNYMSPSPSGYDATPAQQPRTPGIHIPLGSSTQDAERIMILQTLASVGYNKSKTARILGVSRKTLHNKIHALFPEGLEAAAEQAAGSGMAFERTVSFNSSKNG